MLPGRRPPRRTGPGRARAAAAAAAVLLVGAVAAGCGGGAGRPAASAKGAGPAAFAWLAPGPAPAGWPVARLAIATLAYPPAWKRTAADAGTVSAASVDAHGFFHGYLNLTPQQGPETLRGWAAFRAGRNREEGSVGVTTLAAAENLRFRSGPGSCLVDDYTTRVSAHRYRELACIVRGPTATAVLVGAAPPAEWATYGPLIERSAAALVVR